MTLPGKTVTKAYCRCDDEKNCNWKFNKGDVRCVPCPYERMQGKNGIAIVTSEVIFYSKFWLICTALAAIFLEFLSKIIIFLDLD